MIKLGHLTEYEISICKLFSNTCYLTNMEEYTKRKQPNIDKVKLDIFNGKQAEILVYKYLISKRKEVSPPDFMIYTKFNKSFDADIKVINNSIHVKSCQNSSMFPNSWLFEPSDTLITHPLETDFLALVVLGDVNYMYLTSAKGIVYNKPIKNLNKKVIYEKDLL